jgi:hypothetical protein
MKRREISLAFTMTRNETGSSTPTLKILNFKNGSTKGRSPTKWKMLASKNSNQYIIGLRVIKEQY